ncbi:MAG: formyltransferase family protein [Endozoicomonadaceae bacterium]|nr:formyltransferase family protein [Endozoicomonadaceae bacterium]
MADKSLITLLVDNDSWILPYVKKLKAQIEKLGFSVVLCRKAQDVSEGWLCFLLGCIHLMPSTILNKNKHNLVVHESDLPKGRGFSPITCQILEGVNEITVSLFEAKAGVDEGDIWLQESIKLNGTELRSEWEQIQGKITIKLCLRFILEYENLSPVIQVGEPTCYPRRRPGDSKLDFIRSSLIFCGLLTMNVIQPSLYIKVKSTGLKFLQIYNIFRCKINMVQYIVATIKSWNIQAFRDFTPGMAGQWILAQTPGELEDILNKGAKPRYIFFPHWSWIVPKKIWGNHECVCFHMADVPYGRGGSPLQNLIIRGHQETKISALRMIKELDAGPVYLKRPLSLQGKAQDIFEQVAKICYKLIQEIVINEPEPLPQQGDVVVFKRRTPIESELPADVKLSRLYDFIRMLDADSYPKAFINYGNYRLEFSEVHPVDPTSKTLKATVTVHYRNTDE